MSTITLGGLTATLFSSSDLMKIKQRLSSYDHFSPQQIAEDEDFWFVIQQAYTPTSLFINLNNGGVCPQPKVVQESFMHYYKLANQAPAYYMFGEFTRQRESIKKKLATLSGCPYEEISLTRNATEALETVLMGLELKAGDEIITTNQDYPTVMAGMMQRERRDRIKIVKISIPTPAEDSAEVVQRFKAAITPKTKLIVVSHIVYLTGQILPIREICDMAHTSGLEVIVDGAHSFAQLDFKIADLNCDYFGTSLHKWLNAPFGCGMLWMKKEHITKVWSLFGSPDDQKDKMSKFEHLGTRNFPAELAINEAIDFHNGIGIQRKEARLRYLKSYWANAVVGLPKLKFNTSLKEGFSCSLCNFHIEGMTAEAMHKTLMDEHKIFTTMIKHEEFEGVRVTPHLYTKLSDLDRLVEAIQKMVA
ncbi:MAG: aminotransferase class V-fold PLP-dependent enzyme [Chitinophagales bacterium]|nr:aminotransferase class V-fold PLP-dependent enzyme [Chitinophagales bacterium]